MGNIFLSEEIVSINYQGLLIFVGVIALILVIWWCFECLTDIIDNSKIAYAVSCLIILGVFGLFSYWYYCIGDDQIYEYCYISKEENAPYEKVFYELKGNTSGFILISMDDKITDFSDSPKFLFISGDNETIETLYDYMSNYKGLYLRNRRGYEVEIHPESETVTITIKTANKQNFFGAENKYTVKYKAYETVEDLFKNVVNKYENVVDTHFIKENNENDSNQ